MNAVSFNARRSRRDPSKEPPASVIASDIVAAKSANGERLATAAEKKTEALSRRISKTSQKMATDSQ
jgi:hypothetical protein